MKQIILGIALFTFFVSDGFSQKNEMKGMTGDFPDNVKFTVVPYKGNTKPPSKNSNKNSINGVKGIKGTAIDSIKIEEFVPAGKDCSIKLNYQPGNFSFEKLPSSVVLTNDALSAIDSTPVWIQKDLTDNLRRLAPAIQNMYAVKIIAAPPLYRDEVAYQIAHLSPQTLGSMNKDLPLFNARGIYANDSVLQYVDLVEYGSVASGSWYTTTKYRIIDNVGDTVWREIPKEIYYEWVVMPILSDESPIMNSTVYNEFWRTYVFNNADSAYPVLKNVLANTKVFWDGHQYDWNNFDGTTPIPFADSMFATEVVGRWVGHNIPIMAIDPRQIQPNLILHDHNGNCGEIQDLQNAGARAALIPSLSVCTWPGDHVWCEIYWPDSAKWACYQVGRDHGQTNCGFSPPSWTGADRACITVWRSDGYRYMVNEHYNPVCTLTVLVQDTLSNPIDGAEVVFLAAPNTDPHSQTEYYIGSWGHTDQNGELTVQLATGINYGFRADWSSGHDPLTAIDVYEILYSDSGMTVGGHIYRTLTLGGKMPGIQANPISNTELGNYSLGIKYDVPYYTKYGGGYWQYNFSSDNFVYSEKIDSGKINFFICDTSNYLSFSQNNLFNAYSLLQNHSNADVLFGLPNEENFYINLSNRNKYTSSDFLNAKIYLFNGPANVSENNSPDNNLMVYPNPFSSNITIKCDLNKHGQEYYSLQIRDLNGRIIKTLNPDRLSNNGIVYWDGKNESGSLVPDGIYFVQLRAKDFINTMKIVFIK